MPHNVTIAEDFFGDNEVTNRTYSPTQRRMTQQHRQLIERFKLPTESWSRRALHGCLVSAADNTWSMAWGVGVIDAWVEADAAFCVVYRFHRFPNTLGIRRTVDDDPNGVAAADPVGQVNLSPDRAAVPINRLSA